VLRCPHHRLECDVFASSGLFLIHGGITAVWQESHLSACPNFQNHGFYIDASQRMTTIWPRISADLPAGDRLGVKGEIDGLFARRRDVRLTGNPFELLQLLSFNCRITTNAASLADIQSLLRAGILDERETLARSRPNAPLCYPLAQRWCRMFDRILTRANTP
jgi:hypothetical protein